MKTITMTFGKRDLMVISKALNLYASLMIGENDPDVYIDIVNDIKDDIDEAIDGDR